MARLLAELRGLGLGLQGSVPLLYSQHHIRSEGVLRMTMPSERTRSVMQTRDFLRELMSSEDTPGIPPEVRQEARRLLRHFPDASDLNLAAKVLPCFFGRVDVDDPGVR